MLKQKCFHYSHTFMMDQSIFVFFPQRHLNMEIIVEESLLDGSGT